MLKVFALGMVVAAPVYFLERWLPGPATPFFDNLVRVALVEELFKLLPVLLFVYRRREFNEPMDGIVYMGTAFQSFIIGRITPTGDLAADPTRWVKWPVFLVPVAVIGFVLALRIWNARPRPKAIPAEAGA